MSAAETRLFCVASKMRRTPMSVDDTKPATPEEIDESAHFQALYFAWLHARALFYMPIANDQDDPDALIDRRSDDADEAARQLLVRPATSEHHIWWK